MMLQNHRIDTAIQRPQLIVHVPPDRQSRKPATSRWNGNALDAVNDIECLADNVSAALEEDPASTALKKLATTLDEFETYVTNNIGHIVDYGERFRAGERISTGFVESAVNQIVDKRFNKRQSMRWTPRGAHLLLQTRTRVLNGDLDQLIQRRYPGFRQTPSSEFAPGLGWAPCWPVSRTDGPIQVSSRRMRPSVGRSPNKFRNTR